MLSGNKNGHIEGMWPEQSLALFCIHAALAQHFDDVGNLLVDDGGFQRVLFDEHHATFADGVQVLNRPAFNNPHGRNVGNVGVRFIRLLIDVHYRRRHGNFDEIGAFRYQMLEPIGSIHLDHFSNER